METIAVWNETTGRLVGNRVQIADSSLSRMRGLLGRRGLGPGEGLWIRPSSGVHTVGMRFAIDVIGLDKTMRVVRVWKNVVPYRMTTLIWSMDSALEIPAHRIALLGVKVGDQMRIERFARDRQVA